MDRNFKTNNPTGNGNGTNSAANSAFILMMQL
jgi:hypothetical protein